MRTAMDGDDDPAGSITVNATSNGTETLEPEDAPPKITRETNGLCVLGADPVVWGDGRRNPGTARSNETKGERSGRRATTLGRAIAFMYAEAERWCGGCLLKAWRRVRMREDCEIS